MKLFAHINPSAPIGPLSQAVEILQIRPRLVPAVFGSIPLVSKQSLGTSILKGDSIVVSAILYHFDRSEK